MKWWRVCKILDTEQFSTPVLVFSGMIHGGIDDQGKNVFRLNLSCPTRIVTGLEYSCHLGVLICPFLCQFFEHSKQQQTKAASEKRRLLKARRHTEKETLVKYRGGFGLFVKAGLFKSLKAFLFQCSNGQFEERLSDCPRTVVQHVLILHWTCWASPLAGTYLQEREKKKSILGLCFRGQAFVWGLEGWKKPPSLLLSHGPSPYQSASS